MSRSPIAGGADLSTAPQIKQAEPNDIPRMATSLARAFADDPVSNWMLPRARRHTRMIAMFTLMLRSHVSFAETYSTPDGVGVAVWAPPGRWRLDLDVMGCLCPRVRIDLRTQPCTGDRRAHDARGQSSLRSGALVSGGTRKPPGLARKRYRYGSHATRPRSN